MPPLRRLAVLLLWLAVATAYLAAIVPQVEAPHLGYSDKVDHMAAFLTIALLARVAYPDARGATLLLLLAVLGGAIELTQALPVIRRDAEWGDWFADIVASLAGLALGRPLAVHAGRRYAGSAKPQPGSRPLEP